MPQLRGQPQEDRNHKDLLYHLRVSCLSLERIRAKTEIYCKVTIYESLSIISVNLPVKYQIIISTFPDLVIPEKNISISINLY